MKLSINIDMGTDAFDSDPYELYEVLEIVADCVLDGREQGDITDKNETFIGTYEVTE